jgi:extracellular factor (EF) 3-hydroxypalmitic acid methyl ester biosynthesis protein
LVGDSATIKNEQNVPRIPARTLSERKNQLKESWIELTTTAQHSLETALLRITRFDAVIQISTADEVLRASDVLPEVKITTGGRVVYVGRATVRTVVDSGNAVTCELSLDEPGVAVEALIDDDEHNYASFKASWLDGYRILPEFKVVVADVSILLSNLRGWLNHVELTLAAMERADVASQSRELLEEAAPRAIQTFNSQHERFETIACSVQPELRGAHRNFVWRQWNEFFLCTPFGDRTYRKPLGYAGDYEMMNMIHRHAPEGRSLFAKAMHYLLVSQWPAESVRNRITHLKQNLVAETARVVRKGQRARILNLGCGPAWEVQEFIKESPLSNETDFTLMDFNAETISYTGDLLNDLKSRYNRSITLKMQQASVQQLLRSALQGKALAAEQKFDVIYCAGLFDYLSDGTCKAIVNLFYGWLQRGGMVLVANMNDSKPFRHFIESILDWHLIYRNSRTLATLRPHASEALMQIIADPTTVNLFLHARKPE